MTVRDYKPSDAAAVKKLHAGMGMDYRLPDIDDALFLVKKVCEVDGKIVGVELLKVQAEAYLMLDCNLDAIEKTRTIAHLSRETEREAYNRGLDTLCAYIPEEISKKFTKRLELLGWSKAREGWRTWFRELL